MLAVLRDGDQLVPVPLLIENYQDATGGTVNEGECIVWYAGTTLPSHRR